VSRRGVLGSCAAGLGLAAIAAGGWLAFQLGGRVGFEEGLLASSLREGSIHGSTAVQALRAIRAGDTGLAIRHLEDAVDGALLSYWALSQVDLSRFDRAGRLRDVDLSYGRVVARYRNEFPSLNSYEDVRKTVDETAASLAWVPEPDCDPPDAEISEPRAILAGGDAKPSARVR
jgi:hypothetical protein